MTLKQQLDRHIFKRVGISVLIALGVLAFDVIDGFSWILIITACFTVLIPTIFEINKNYLVQIAESEGTLFVTYYNFLDKIVNEEIPSEYIRERDINKSGKNITLTLKDYRVLSLYYLSGISGQHDIQEIHR